MDRLIRFGLFEIDPAAGEIRKEGRRIKLQDQPFQLLLVLVEHPGEVVTREEIQSAVWPADTFVDFDHGVNTAIKKIRLALGDSAENPRFIETLPRKGYRFIAPVTTAETKETTEPVAPPVPTAPTRNWRLPGGRRSRPAHRRRLDRWRRFLVRRRQIDLLPLRPVRR